MKPLTKLKPTWEKFSQLYVKDSNATEAYRGAGFRAKTDRAIEVGASNLLKNPLVAARIAELTEKAGKKTEVTREKIINELADIAFKEGETDTAGERNKIKALELLGKRFALWIERHQQDGPGWEEVFRLLSPETRQMVMRDLDGVEVPDVGAEH